MRNLASAALPIYQLLKKNIPFILGKKQVKTIDLLKLALITPFFFMSLDNLRQTSEIILAINATLDE